MTKKRTITKATLKKHKQIIDVWFTNGFNGRSAYKVYFPKSKDTTATCNFSKIKDSKEIKEYINEKHEEAAKIIDVTHEGILGELKRWVESDITDTMELTPSEVKSLPITLKRLISKYKTTTRQIHNSKGEVTETIKTVELHFVSKEKAIEMINKHIGFYEADNKQKIPEVDYSSLDAATLKNIWDARKRN